MLARGLVEGRHDFCVLVNEPDHPPSRWRRFSWRPSSQSPAPPTSRSTGVRDRARAPPAPLHRLRRRPGDARTVVAGGAEQEQLPAKIVARVASLDEMLALAMTGVGIAALPNYFVSSSLADGQVELVGPAPDRAAAVPVTRSSSPGGRAPRRAPDSSPSERLSSPRVRTTRATIDPCIEYKLVTSGSPGVVPKDEGWHLTFRPSAGSSHG